MKNQSLTISGVAIIFLVFLGQNVGVEIAPENVQTTIETLTQFVGIVMAYVGRFRHGDISWFGSKN